MTASLWLALKALAHHQGRAALLVLATAFCAVVRPDDHPLRPRDYAPLDAFWTKRGYTRHPELVARFRWQDLTDGRHSEKPLVFWLKQL